MLRKNSKAMALAIALVFCMSFIFTGFVVPQQAVAGDMYQVIKAPTVTPASPAAAQNIGAVVKVTVPDMAIAAGSILTVSMPSEWTFPTNAGVVPVSGTVTGNVVEVVATQAVAAAGDDLPLNVAAFAAANFAITPNKTFDLKFAAAIPATQLGANRYFYLYFNGVNLNNSSGDLALTLIAPSGSAFETALNLTIGKSSRDGATTTTIKKVKEIAGDDTLDIVSVLENSAGTIDMATPGTIKLKIMTKGFTWDNTAFAASYGWDFLGGPIVTPIAAILSADEKTIAYPIAPAAAAGAPYANPGKISFANLPIVVDDTTVTAGTEVEVEVSGADMTKATVVVAKYVDFGLTVAEGTTKAAIAGQDAVKVGTFSIKESAAGSWVAGRTVTFELPEGAQWDTVGDIDVMNSSDIVTPVGSITGDNDEFLKVTLPAGGASTTGGAKIDLSDFKVDLAPDFDGPVEVTVTGNAGTTGKLKIADAKPIAYLQAGEIKDIKIGGPNQQIGDITIVENTTEGLLNNAGIGNDIRLIFDPGYRFAKVPTVKVTEGDLDIDVSGVSIDENELIIPVKSQSAKTAAKILISDIYVDAYRTAPEGKVSIKFDKGTSAVNELAVQFPNVYPDEVQVANCVTPAPGEGTAGTVSGSFNIDSNIYYVNGVAKVMDVAPYIKSGRTYVPVRYLGLALGVADADVVWDAATQKVTMTLGDKVIVMTIGSTTMTINGEAKVLDVAPEITNGRTMLPARYVAEGLGYVVGWDPGTRTVLVSR